MPCFERELRRVGASLALVVATACGYPQPSAEPESFLPALRQMERPPAGDAWPIPPAEAERLLWRGEFEIVSWERSEGGQREAFKTELRIDGRPLRVKLKQAPRGALQDWNTSPRKELAAYAVQRWILDPADYVVPTAALRCIALEDYRRLEPEAEPSLPDTRCVVVTVSLWLEGLEPAVPLYEAERFPREPHYAYHMANLNAYTFLVAHRDARPDNFLQSRDPANRRVFAVDNEVSFGQRRYNYLRRQWYRLYVPAVRSEVVERLRALQREQVDALETVAVLLKGEAGVLRAAPSAEPGEPVVVRFGLSERERDGVWQRRNELLERVERGELDVF